MNLRKKIRGKKSLPTKKLVNKRQSSPQPRINPAFRQKVRKADAKEIGYSYMLLDTLPFLEKAIHIYKQFGFYTIDCYNNSPMSTSIYMRLDL